MVYSKRQLKTRLAWNGEPIFRCFLTVFATVGILIGELLVVTLELRAAPPAAATPQFEFELFTEQNFPITGAQKWQQLLTDFKPVNLQIRALQSGDKPAIERRGTQKSPVFHIRGVLTAGSLLIVPGGKFSTSDKADLAKWLKELGENGVEGVTVKKAAFGLTPSQLEAVHQDLRRPIDFSTKGMPPGQAIGKIRQSLKLSLRADAGVTDLFGADDRVQEELEGLSSGTAIAIILRPAGAMLQPHKPAGGEVEYRAAKAEAGAEAWPIGWPSEAAPNKTVPDLFEFLNVEFDQAPLADVLTAIQARLKVPIIVDQNSLAAQQIDIAKPISFPAKKTFYGKVLEDVLFKARLKYEIRLDEAEKPFLWVTTIKRP